MKAMREPHRSVDLGVRITLVVALAFVVLPFLLLGIYFVVRLRSTPAETTRRTRYGTKLERAFARLQRPIDDAELRRARDAVEREEACDEILRAVGRACAEEAPPRADRLRLIAELRRLCDRRAQDGPEARRLEFGLCVLLLRHATHPWEEDEALSRIWHLDRPYRLAPDYDFVWIHLQAERYDEAAQAAAEALEALEQDTPDVPVHLAFHAWLRARAARASRLAEDPPPPREPEREEQAADDAGPR